MPSSPEHLRRLTYALRDPERAAAAATALGGVDGPGVREGLFDLLAAPPNNEAALAAIRALAGDQHPLAREALSSAALAGTPLVRQTALQVLRLQHDSGNGPVFGMVLARDTSVRLRREAIRALGKLPAQARWPLLTALSDPVWRVRHDAVRFLCSWQREASDLLAQIRVRVEGNESPLVAGALRYLQFLTTPGMEPPPRSTPGEPWEPWRRASWWDDDPPVLEQNLRHLTRQQVRADLALFPGLLTLQDGRPVWPHLQGIYRFTVTALERFGSAEHLTAALALLDEPRLPQTGLWVGRLFARLTPERCEELAAWVLQHPSRAISPLLWALEKRQNVTDDDPDPELRCLCARALAEPAVIDPALQSCLERLQRDPDHRVRAMALTHSRAEELWQQPGQETSWHVLARAAEILGHSLEEIAPAGYQAMRPLTRGRTQEERSPARLREWAAPAVAQPRSLGRTGLVVSPLGLSGRHELPERGFREAIEAGINLFFWEPTYRRQTRCWQQLSASAKEPLVVVAGSFAVDARSVREDLEQALHLLHVPRVGVFLLFWVRSRGRLAEETLETLAELRESGLVGAVGLSTHLRSLAAEAVADGWDVLMVRHSLAHRAAETEVFPLACKEGTGLITFTGLCYGRLPQAPEAPSARRSRPTPAECYRYSLSQPGVTACLSAPRDLEQLRHNLQVLQNPTLTPEEMTVLRPWGDAVYRQHRAFVTWLR
jgi:aryl-alcohol dehydrogenase-like predicted oxidoreductase